MSMNVPNLASTGMNRRLPTELTAENKLLNEKRNIEYELNDPFIDAFVTKKEIRKMKRSLKHINKDLRKTEKDSERELKKSQKKILYLDINNQIPKSIEIKKRVRNKRALFSL